MEETVTVACILIRRDDLVLGVSRRDNHDDWGLPGGKLEPGEDPLVGGARELFEETGVRVRTEDLIEVYRARDGDWIAVTYEAKKWEGAPQRRSGEGLVDWVSWQAIEQGSFGAYNQELRKCIG